MCGVFNHHLVDGVYLTNPKHISFTKKLRNDFRPNDPICLACRNTIEFVFCQASQRVRDSRMNAASTFSSISTDSSDSNDSMILNLKAISMLSNSSEQIGTQEGVNQTGSSAKMSIVENQSHMTASTAVPYQPPEA